MAIQTIDGVLAGALPPQDIFKVGTAPESGGRYHSHWYAAGRPGAATAPTDGVNGAVLTTHTAAIPFTNPSGGALTYIARWEMATTVACTLLLCDRLWHNSGLSVTATTLQSITSPTWPARDLNGTTSGNGVFVGLEVSTVTGAGTPTCTLTYTDEAGNTGATATYLALTAANVGSFDFWPLASGDFGVRAVTGYQQSATRTSGAIHLVAFRVLAWLPCGSTNVAGSIDALSSGMIRLYDNTVPFIVQLPTTSTGTNLSGRLVYTQG